VTRLTLVVSGFSEMGEALENTGYFETIHSISSTSELRELTRAHVLLTDLACFLYLPILQSRIRPHKAWKY